MERSAHIELRSDAVKARFDWLAFDGDDCFEVFQISVTAGEQSRTFEFGTCAVNGLRKLVRFFSDSQENGVSGGFRHPDIRSYDLHRSGESFHLVIRFEGSGLEEKYDIQHPSVHIADEFLRAYDG